MRKATPRVFLVARTQPLRNGLEEYLEEVGGQEWLDGAEAGAPGTAEYLAEFAGRICYRSWAPGLNKNVTRVRADHAGYLRNILAQRHGSVLEHVSYSFVFYDVSRVCTHELVRHRPGVAVSQESMRYVRLENLPFWIPDWAQDDEELMAQVRPALSRLEWLQKWMAGHFGLDDQGRGFAEKKARTSFMRRLAPEGVGTSVLWTANVRTLRHVIEARTAPGAEEEIRLVFGMVAEIMQAEAPSLFGDFTRRDDGSWVPEWSKV